MSICYINKKANYVIERVPLDGEANFVSCDNKEPILDISKFIMDYGLKFYYLIFGDYELAINKYKFTPIFSSVEKVNFDDLHESFKLLFSLNHNLDEKRFQNFSRDFNKNWECRDYIGNKIKQVPLYDYGDFYRQCYEYLNTLATLRNSRILKATSIIAMVIALISLVLSIIFAICKN